MEDWQEREELLIGKDNIDKLKNATVAVFGCGGVGSYTVEALARAGIGNFVLVDKDVVDVTNINRQLVADFSTIGRDKVEVEKERILRVNPDAKVEIYKEFYCEENKEKLIQLFEFRIPYYVGPLNCTDGKDEKFTWAVRKSREKIS